MNRAWAVLGATVFLVLSASPASAHATLVETSPSDGSHLDTAPEEVTVTFDEPVEAPVASVRVFDDSGVRVDLGDAGPGDTPAQIRVSVARRLAGGTYVATWRAVSLDGHPVRGGFIFHVGHGAAGVDPSLVAALLGEGGEVGFAAAGAVIRWVTYTAALVAVGTLVFLVVVAGRAAEERVRRLAGVAAVVGIVGSVVQVPLFGAEATGLGTGALASTPALLDAAWSPLGRASLARSLTLGLLMAVARRLRLQPWVWVGLAGLAFSELLVGHTLTTKPGWLVMTANVVHVAAAALWLGGLTALLISFREAKREDDPTGAAAMVARFSRLASWSVLALAVAGVGLAWAEVRAFRALTSTAYGWTLVAKTSLGLAVLGVGAYNNRVLVPAITQRAAPAPVGDGRAVATIERTTGPAWGRLRRTVRYEVAGLVAVLAVTAVLVNLQPAAEAAGVSGPFSAIVPFGEGELNLVVDPNRVGSNGFHVYILTPAGLPAAVTGDAVFEFRLPAEEIGPLVREPQVAGPGHWTYTGPDLAIPGMWEMTFRLTDEFDEETATISVTVNP
jgi:copper transport protein